MLNEGQLNRTGIRILMQSETEALPVPPNGSIAYLKLVDGSGNVIVPEYEPDGLQTGMGPLPGAKYVLVSTADYAALEARVAALEAEGPLACMHTPGALARWLRENA